MRKWFYQNRMQVCAIQVQPLDSIQERELSSRRHLTTRLLT